MKSTLLSSTVDKYKYVVMSNHLFDGVDNDHLFDVLDYLRAYSRTYEKNENITSLSDEINYAGLVLDGKAKVLFYDEAQNLVTLRHVYPGELFCITVSLLPDYRVNFEVISENKSDVLFVNISLLLETKERIFKNYEYHLLLSSNLIKLICRYAEFLEEKICILGQRKTKDKLKIHLSRISDQHGSEFSLPVSFTDLASYLNTDRSQLYKSMNDLIDESYLEFNKKSIKLLKAVT